MTCVSRKNLQNNRESTRDSLYLITISFSALVRRKIVIIFYVKKEKICISKIKGNSLVAPSLKYCISVPLVNTSLVLLY